MKSHEAGWNSTHLVDLYQDKAIERGVRDVTTVHSKDVTAPPA